MHSVPRDYRHWLLFLAYGRDAFSWRNTINSFYPSFCDYLSSAGFRVYMLSECRSKETLGDSGLLMYMGIQLFPLYNELKSNTQERMNMIIGGSIGSAILTYEVISVFGYLTFGSEVGLAYSDSLF